MRYKKPVKIILIVIISLLLLVCVVNLTIDPFGVFGDRIFNRYDYNIAANPLAAKDTYIKRHRDEFDSFIIGGAAAAAFSPEQLGGYTGGKYYNMYYDGASMEELSLLTRYLLENYKVKNLVLPLGLSDLAYAKKLPQPLPPAVGGNAFAFYARQLFRNPRHSLTKLQSLNENGYLSESHGKIVAETGVYDNTFRDVAYIGSTTEYLAANPIFNEPVYHRELDTAAVAENLALLRDLCAETGVSLTVIFTPQYSAWLEAYKGRDIDAFRETLAGTVDLWDFSDTPVSRDARYFYDTDSMRTALGNMVLARIYGDAQVWYPPEFGAYVKQGEAAPAAVDENGAYTTDIPVLLFHHFAPEGDRSTVVSAEQFDENMAALCDAGYTAVTPEQLVAYVEKGVSLPVKPMLITIDDGYESNYEVAYPILKKYGMKATIFVIGVSNGRDTYKDTGIPITPHFGDAEMREMAQSGVISIQSHTYDMHRSETLDDPWRNGVLRMESEDETVYIEHFREDIARSKLGIEGVTGEKVIALAFPGGQRDILSDMLLYEAGIKLTFTTQHGVSTIVKGLPQSLFRMKRINVEGGVTGAEIIGIIEKE